MKRLIKWFLGLVVALALFLVVAAAAALLLIDPNDYRDALAARVKEATGRELVISGEVKLSLFPWLGLKLGAMQLANAKGFGEQPFARIEGAEARVKLLPLLSLQTEIDTVSLRGLALDLKRRADGVSNWDDLAGGKPQASTAGKKLAVPQQKGTEQRRERLLGALAIGGIKIEEASVSWRDAQGGQDFSLQRFNLESGAIHLGRPFPLTLSTGLQSSNPQMQGTLYLSGSVTADPLAERYRVDGLEFAAKFSGKGLPGGAVEARLGGDVAADLAAQTVELKGVALNALGLEMRLTAKGTQIIDKPAISAQLQSGEFIPRDLMARLGIALPEMADPSTLGKAQLSLQMDAGADRVALKDIALQLDATTLSGTASLTHFSAPVIRYQLKLDGVDADRYLPPPEEAPAPAAAAKQTAAAAPDSGLPLPLLRGLDIDGTLTIDKLKVMNLHSETITATLRAQRGKFRLHPLGAKLYGGGYSGDLGLDVTGDTPLLSLNEKLSGVQAGPLLQDFMGKPLVTGEAQLQARMTAQGLDAPAIRRSLNGEGSFRFANGTVKGVNLGQQIRNAYALYKKQPKPAEEEKVSDFADLTGTFLVKDGLLSTSDLSASSPVLQVLGKGTANLVNEQLDLRLDTTIIHDKRDVEAGGTAELRGRQIPVTVKGSFSDPKFGVDIGSVLKAKAQAEIDKKKEEAKAKLDTRKQAAEAEAKKKAEAEKKRLEQQVQDKLKKMLKF